MWITPDSQIGRAEIEFWEKDGIEDKEEREGGDTTGTTKKREAVFEDAHPIILLTASSSVSTELSSTEGYVQGAADDAENWAMGSTPRLFWANHDALLSEAEADLPSRIAEILARDKMSSASPSPSSPGKEVAKNLFVHPLPLPRAQDAANECQVVFLPEVRKKEDWVVSESRMEAGLGNQRVTSKFLRGALPDICSFVERFLVRHHQLQQDRDQEPEQNASERASEVVPRIVVACESGKDISLGAALAIRCYLFDDEGNFHMPGSERKPLNKVAIRMKLSRMMMAYPDANPHRSTLQSVNSFLMG